MSLCKDMNNNKGDIVDIVWTLQTIIMLDVSNDYVGWCLWICKVEYELTFMLVMDEE